MEMELTIKNYRSFADAKPARLILRPGFTALVGPNNSGKSSLLRFFYEFRPLFTQLSDPSTVLLGLQQNRQGLGTPASVLDQQELFSDTNSRDLQIDLKLPLATSGRNSYRFVERFIIIVSRTQGQWVAQTDLTAHLEDVSRLRLDGTALEGGPFGKAELSNVFQAFETLRQMVYIPSFRNAINQGSNEEYFDIQVGQAFIQRWREYKEGRQKLYNRAAIQVTADIRNIFGFTTLEINPSSDNTTLQLIINDRPYKLHEVGSGLAQFVITLVNAAIRRPSYILIDEPELGLHPKLQLHFLEALGSLASEGVLFATHNYGLARAAANLIYTVQQDSKGVSGIRELEATHRLSEFLGEMSFSAYRDVGFEKLLLVEGVTDITTIRQFLRKIGMDGKFMLLHLGGSALINANAEQELEEIKRICSDVSAIVDSERTSERASISTEREGFRKACRNAGVRCHILERRAMENYLSERAIKVVKSGKYRALKPYEALENVSPAWAKAENWKIAQEMTIEELEGTDLKQFLASL